MPFEITFDFCGVVTFTIKTLKKGTKFVAFPPLVLQKIRFVLVRS